MLDISEIKLIRTDTTLDLSQKAEKVWANMRSDWGTGDAHWTGAEGRHMNVGKGGLFFLSWCRGIATAAGGFGLR